MIRIATLSMLISVAVATWGMEARAQSKQEFEPDGAYACTPDLVETPDDWPGVTHRCLHQADLSRSKQRALVRHLEAHLDAKRLSESSLEQLTKLADEHILKTEAPIHDLLSRVWARRRGGDEALASLLPARSTLETRLESWHDNWIYDGAWRATKHGISPSSCDIHDTSKTSVTLRCTLEVHCGQPPGRGEVTGDLEVRITREGWTFHPTILEDSRWHEVVQVCLVHGDLSPSHRDTLIDRLEERLDRGDRLDPHMSSLVDTARQHVLETDGDVHRLLATILARHHGSPDALVSSIPSRSELDTRLETWRTSWDYDSSWGYRKPSATPSSCEIRRVSGGSVALHCTLDACSPHGDDRLAADLNIYITRDNWTFKGPQNIREEGSCGCIYTQPAPSMDL